MRLISALLCFLLTFNVLASSGTIQGLERALDEYQYALTVEWNQEDEDFQQAATQKFYGQLGALMEQGLTQSEILDVLSKKIRNPKELEALKLKLTLVASHANTSSELASMMAQEAKNLYSTGASWEGYMYVSIGAGLLVVGLLAYSIWWSSSTECVATGVGQQCGWVNPFPNYDPNYPNYPSQYQCWQTTYCTEYAKN